MNGRINREWIEILDPEDGHPWLFDKSFLLSNWTCIYGNGCKGVLTDDATDLNQGCCSYGAHFSDQEDLNKVKKASKKLDESIWQFKKVADKKGFFKVNKSGETVTRLVKDACIFLNRNGFEGGTGCALHIGSMRDGIHHSQYKPDVCWQLPLRKEDLTFESNVTVTVVKSWERSDWGEGGNEFHWWCTQDSLAYVGSRPVYKELMSELELLCGKKLTELLKTALEDLVKLNPIIQDNSKTEVKLSKRSRLSS
jgi:hypothetical protein